MRRRLHPDAAAVVFDHVLHQGEPQAQPGEAMFPVGTQEGLEQPFLPAFRDADAVILHGDYPLLALPLGGYPDAGWARGAALECIADQVLQYLAEQRPVAGDDWRRVVLEP